MSGETVTICVIEPTEPFICDVRGGFCIHTLQEIEKQFAQCCPHGEVDVPDGAFTVTYAVSWCPGQYGDEGRCEIEPYWDMDVISHTTIDEDGISDQRVKKLAEGMKV